MKKEEKEDLKEYVFENLGTAKDDLDSLDDALIVGSYAAEGCEKFLREHYPTKVVAATILAKAVTILDNLLEGNTDKID